MSALRLLLRFYSYLVHGAIAVAALAMSAMVVLSVHHSVQIGWLPWTGDRLGAWLAGVGVCGLAVILLALAGRMRWLLPLYSLGVIYLVVNGVFLSRWQFGDGAEFRMSLWILGGLVVAFVGAVPRRKNGLD